MHNPIPLTLPLGLLVAGGGLAPVFLTDSCGAPPVDDWGQPDTLYHDPLYAEDNPLLAPIPPDAEIDPESEVYIQKMAEVVATGGILMTTNTWSAPLYYADPGTPRYDVALTVYGTEGYCGKHWLLDVPIPAFAKQDPEGDAHMTIVDRERGCVYDFWGYGQDPLVDLKTSWWASALPIASDGIYHDSLGAGNAAGLSLPNGSVWPDEIAAGYIGHALVFGYSGVAVKAGSPVPPATHSDGGSTEVGALPEGAWVQLDPELDLDSLPLTDAERIIARALQEFGMILVDVTGGGVRIGAISGISSYPNAWEGIVPEGAGDSVWLNGIPVESMRVLKLPPPAPPREECVTNNPCQTYQ